MDSDRANSVFDPFRENAPSAARREEVLQFIADADEPDIPAIAERFRIKVLGITFDPGDDIFLECSDAAALTIS